MTRIEFTVEEIEKLRYESFHHPHPRVQLKMEALLLKSQGVPHWQICNILAITENTLRAYLQAYLEGGVEKLKELNFPCPQSELAGHAETLEAYFRQHPPATIKEAVAKIEELTGIRRSETQVRQFLKSLGMRRLKLGAIPAKADPETQAIFKKRGAGPAIGQFRAIPGTPYLILDPGWTARVLGGIRGLPALVHLRTRGPRRGPARPGEPALAAGVAAKGPARTRWRAILEFLRRSNSWG